MTSTPTTEERAVFLCGAYRFSGDVGRGLIEALPPTLPLRAAAADDPLHDVIALLSRELSGPPRAADRARPPARCLAGARHPRVFGAESRCASLVSGYGRDPDGSARH